MPFVLDISLGHEILHSWFGNSVYVDYSQGNWCEGLTSYLADHYFAELKNEGQDYRHQILSDYKSYVNDKNDFPLCKFTARTDRASRAIGYGKAAMIFHMLRKMSGDRVFFSAVRDFSLAYRFKTASWHDIQDVFTKKTGLDLSDFFSQWLERRDIPVINVKDTATVQDNQAGFRMKLEIEQENEVPYALRIPVTILTEKEEIKKLLTVSRKLENITISLTERPVIAILDQDYDIMRDLSPSEFPPSISRLFGAEKRLVILPEEDEMDVYHPLITFLEQSGFKSVPRNQLKHSMFKKGSFVILGKTSGRLSSLGPDLACPEAGIAVAVKNNPFNPSSVTCAIKASSSEECRKVMFKLPHYGKYSFLKFKNGIITEKKKADYERGIRIQVKKPMYGISSRNISNAPDIINSLSDARVIYLGERHDQESIHEAQLRIIRALGKKGPVAVAMEMFQKPFQKVVNAYLEGKISEREFLKKTEYFKRWGFNYHFYRPIVEYCRITGTPIIAMNLPAEISKKVARSGIRNLNHEEKQALPDTMDMSNKLYRHMLREIFEGHGSQGLEDFDHFFQAQIAWDETMAENISGFIKANPERKVIVIVGGGHVAFGYGIPSRVAKRQPGIKQNIVLFPQTEQPDPLEADYFLFVPKSPEPFVARLGVMLSGEDKLKVENVVPGSPAAQAGIKKGDKILAMDDREIKDISDLKLELFFKNRGDTARIKVKRTEKDGRMVTRELTTGPLVPFDWKVSGFRFHGKR